METRANSRAIRSWSAGLKLGHERHLLARPAEVHLRLEVRRVPDDDVDLEAVLGGVHRQIAAGVAASDDQHPVALDVVGVLVSLEWICGPAEAAGTWGILASQRWPLATSTPSYASAPSEVVTVQPADPTGPWVAIGTTETTSVPNDTRWS